MLCSLIKEVSGESSVIDSTHYINKKQFYDHFMMFAI